MKKHAQEHQPDDAGRDHTSNASPKSSNAYRGCPHVRMAWFRVNVSRLGRDQITKSLKGYNMAFRPHLFHLKTTICVVALVAGTAVHAQDAVSQHSMANSAGTQPTETGEIVVTAQKRVERLQDVPVSVSVLTGNALQSKSILTLQELAGAVPTVTIARSGPIDRKFVRGIGNGDNPGFDSVVGTFVDDIYHGRSRTSASGLFDLDRVEFLKGPQVTFFGNSAIAGSVNMTTVKPSDRANGYLFGSYNFDFHQYTVEGAYGGHLTDTLSARISGVVGEGDGYIYDTISRSKVPETNDRAVRGQLRWQPNDDLSVNAKAEVGRFLQKGASLMQIKSGCPPTAPFTIRPFCTTALARGDDVTFNETRASDGKDFANLRTQEYQLTADYDLGGATLSSNTAYYKYKFAIQFDLDLTSAQFQSGGAPENYNQFSQELRITSDSDRPLEYMFGLYFQRDRINGNQNYTFYTLGLPSTSAFYPLGVELGFNQLERMYAGFGSLKWKLSENFSIMAGARGQIVRKSLVKPLLYGTGADYVRNSVIPFAGADALGASTIGYVPGTQNLSRQDEQITPTVSAQYKIQRDIMVYGSYSRGWQAGGFNLVNTTGNAALTPFRPEKVDAFEVGLKSQLFNRKLTFNLIAFHSRYSDLQVGGNIQAIPVPIGVVNNAGEAISRGVELDTDWAVTRRLSTSVKFTWLDAHYSKYPNATPTPLQSLQGKQLQDLAGHRTPYAPVYSGNWTVNYTQPLAASTDLVFGSNLVFTGRYAAGFNDDPNIYQKAYEKLDLSLRLVNHSQEWELGLVAKNVTDKKTSQYISSAPASPGGYIAQLDPTRSISLQVRKAF
jgi:iron complex outermembrane receptor protein